MKHHLALLGSEQLTAGSEEGSELAMRGRLEKEMREEGRVDYCQLTLEDGEMNNPPPGGNELAKRETQQTLGGEQGLEHAGGVEQRQGEKPPWDFSYMMEEENSVQLILQEDE